MRASNCAPVPCRLAVAEWSLLKLTNFPPPFTAVDEIDWRAYAATKGLSEKQQKIADKVGRAYALRHSCAVWLLAADGRVPTDG